jgi:hypothetical protein
MPSVVSVVWLVGAPLWLCGLPLVAAVTRILFIGNSYTYFNAGVPTEVAGLAPGDIEVVTIAPGGMTLPQHYATASTLDTIRTGNFNFVVLQEQVQN